MNDDWATGGLIGALVGVIGGPIGMLLGGSIGALTGSLVDLDDAESQVSVFDKVSSSLTQEGTALLLIAQEEDNKLENYLRGLGATEVIRESVAEVEASILQAQEAQRALEKQAREEMRQQKRDDFRQKAQERQNQIKDKFSNIFTRNKES